MRTLKKQCIYFTKIRIRFIVMRIQIKFLSVGVKFLCISMVVIGNGEGMHKE